MKTASIMVNDKRVVCVETYDTETCDCSILNPEGAADLFASETVYVWGNGEFFEGCIDLKNLFFARNNFYIAFRAFGPFKSIKPSVQLAALLSGAKTDGRVFWTTRAGVEKAWWDPIFLSL
ncbi:MAG: hypothetical protein ACPGR8_15090 [Limisphaerales bacterium]